MADRPWFEVTIRQLEAEFPVERSAFVVGNFDDSKRIETEPVQGPANTAIVRARVGVFAFCPCVSWRCSLAEVAKRVQVRLCWTARCPDGGILPPIDCQGVEAGC